jgi:nucleotide-binding universal stress UspA family protein
MTRIKTILHPTDFSRNANYAFRLACALARDYGAKLMLLYVRPLPVVPPTEIVTLPAEPAEYHDVMREKLEGLRAEDYGVAVERYRLVGDEAEEIIRLAENTGCDLIVMGTHGRSGLSRLLMGSVAEMVVRKAPCPVLTVKQPAGASKMASELGPERFAQRPTAPAVS